MNRCHIRTRNRLTSGLFRIALPLACFFIPSLTAHSQTSVYHPFPETNVIWREYLSGLGFNCCCSGPVCISEDQFEHFLNGDTLVGTLIYKKIYKTGINVQFIGGPGVCPPNCNNYTSTPYHDIYVGAFRQDSIQRKVYFLPANNMQENLLYDFNLSVGDTLPETYNNSYPTNVVTTIDSILVGNEYHTRYRLSVPWNTEYVDIIEGIGSTYGLLFQLYPPFEFFNTLICVMVDSITVYHDTLFVCDIISSELPEPVFRGVSVAPNPASEFTVISVSGNKSISQVLTLIDILGKPVRRVELENGTAILNRDGLPGGIYFLQGVTDGKKFFCVKLLFL